MQWFNLVRSASSKSEKSSKSSRIVAVFALSGVLAAGILGLHVAPTMHSAAASASHATLVPMADECTVGNGHC